VGLEDKYKLTRQENIFLAKKMLTASVYSSARLENINVTFPDTQTILDGVAVPRMAVDDIHRKIHV
jgi:hypothetical protein